VYVCHMPLDLVVNCVCICNTYICAQGGGFSWTCRWRSTDDDLPIAYPYVEFQRGMVLYLDHCSIW